MNCSKVNVGLSRLAEVGSYPVIIFVGFTLYMTFAEVGLDVRVASYGAALAGVCFIVLHEVVLPYR